MTVDNCPLSLPSLAGVCHDALSAAAAADGLARPRLRERLASVPDPRSLPGRRHPLEFVLALAVCAFTAAGHHSPAAIADWAAGCSQQTLAALGGRRDPRAMLVRLPCERTFRRVFSKVDGAALNDCIPARPTRGQRTGSTGAGATGSAARSVIRGQRNHVKKIIGKPCAVKPHARTD